MFIRLPVEFVQEIQSLDVDYEKEIKLYFILLYLREVIFRDFRGDFLLSSVKDKPKLKK